MFFLLLIALLIVRFVNFLFAITNSSLLGRLLSLFSSKLAFSPEI